MSNSKYKQEVELFNKQIYELEKTSIYLSLIKAVTENASSLKAPKGIDDVSDLSDSETEKRRADLTIYVARCEAALDVIKELEALRQKSERKHREAEKQYDSFCKRNNINNHIPDNDRNKE